VPGYCFRENLVNGQPVQYNIQFSTRFGKATDKTYKDQEEFLNSQFVILQQYVGDYFSAEEKAPKFKNTKIFRLKECTKEAILFDKDV